MDTVHLEIPKEFDFPFTPYDIQQQFMENLFFTIETKKLGIFESPTGTGKSLSIICGAIRWLKEYTKQERFVLQKKMEEITAKKQNIAESTDWLSSQAKEIELTESLNKLKLEQNKILAYDEKLEKMKANKKLRDEKKLLHKQFLDKGKSSELFENLEEKLIDDDDLLLEEISSMLQESAESEEDENDNKYDPPKIFISSRTHSQLSQFVGEILKSLFSKDIRVVSLGSRQNYCINPQVLKLRNMALINEKCLDMQNKTSKCKTDSDGKVVKKQKGSGKCPFFRQLAIDELKESALLQVQDIEDLVNIGKESKACPYYASRKAAEDAEVVLIPYNTLLHKPTREANGITLKNNIVIIDEAHNLLEALAQMHNSEVNHNQLEHSLLQLKNYKQRYNTRFSAPNLLSINQLIFVTSRLFKVLDEIEPEVLKETKTNIYTLEDFVLSSQIDNYNMFKLIEFCRHSRISQKLHSFAAKYSVEEMQAKTEKTGLKKFLSSIENKKGKKIDEPEIKPTDAPKKSVPSNPLLAVISFLQSLTYSYKDGRILVHKTPEKSTRKLQFLLLNPASNFRDIVSEARSVIVAGGTMKPNSEFRDRLFISAGADPNRIVEFSCDHIIPPENILPIIMTKGLKGESLLFNFDNRMSMGSNIKSIMQEACRRVRGGIVVFFPSYKYENWVWQQVKDVNFERIVLREPQDSGSVDTVLTKYAEAIERNPNSGALLLSVVGGKLSEGLNFSDDLGRCVIVVGLPYANITAVDLKEKMAYLDKTEGMGAGQKFYEGLCMKAVNQCIGRAVRHKNDYATVLLLDQRYDRQMIKNALPGWIKRSLKVATFQESFQMIDKFFPAMKNKRT